MPKIVEFEGARHEFPDDFTDQEISDALAGASAPAAPAAAVPAPAAQAAPVASSAPLINRQVRAGLQGAGKGVAELASLPFDLTNAGANILLAGADKASQFVGGPKLDFRFPSTSEEIAGLISKGAESVGYDVLDPRAMSGRERLAYDVNRFGTQAAGGAYGLARAASARAPEIAAGAGHRFGDPFLRSYMGENIGKTIAGDAAAAAGSGVGAATAHTYAPDSPIAAAFAPLVGGVGGITALTAGAAGVKGAASAAGRPFGMHLDKNVNVDPETLLPTTKKASDMAAGVIQNEAADPQSIPGFVRSNREAMQNLSEPPTAFQLSEDPGLAALDRTIGMQNPGKEMARQRRFQSGVRDAVDASVPEGATPEALVGKAQQTADERMSAAEGKVARVEKRQGDLARIRSTHGEEVSDYRGEGVPASQELHDVLVESGYKPARAAKNEAFAAIDPDKSRMIDAAPLVEAATKVRDSVNKLGPQKEQLPAEFVQRLESLTPDGGAATVAAGDVADLRKYLSTAYDKAQRAGNFTLADSISDLRRAVNKTLEDIPEAAEATTQYKEFANVYRPDFKDEMAKFTREVDRGMEPPPSQTAGRFLRAGQPEKAESLGRAVSSLKEPVDAQTPIRRYLMSDLAERGAIAADGSIKAQAVESWARDHAANIDLVPGFRSDVDDLLTRAQKGERIAGSFAEKLKGAQKGVRQTQAEIDKGALGLVLDADPDKAVAAVMSNPNRSGRLLDELIQLTEKDKGARNGLKAAVHNYIVNKATTTATEKMKPGDRRGPVSPAKLTQVFNEHEKELAKIFDAEEMNGLRAGHRALELSNIERLRTGSGSDTAEKIAVFDKLMATPLGKGIDGFMRLKFGMLRGGGIMAVVRRQTAGMTDKTADEVHRLIERARQDPELLILLAGRKLPVSSPAWNKRLNALLAVGEGAREINDRDEPPPK